MSFDDPARHGQLFSMRRSLRRSFLLGSALVALVGCTPNSRETEVAVAKQPFVSAGDMKAKHGEVAAIETAMGVMVIGGAAGGSDTTATEVWDPVGGTWTSLKDLTFARSGHTATVLGTGRVAVVGGHITETGEIWDPGTDTWAPMTSDGARSRHTAILTSAGDLLVVGGTDGAADLGAKLYDPAADAWAAAGTLKTPRVDHAMAGLTDGRVVVFGGLTSPSTYLSSVEAFDPATKEWTAGASLSAARAQIASVNLADGKVLLAGGTDGTAVSTVEVWDPATGTATAKTAMSEARAGARAVLLPSGRVLVLGGAGAAGVSKTTEVFDPTADKWTKGPDLAVARRGFAAMAISGGRVLIAGGNDGSTDLSSAEVFGGAAPGAPCTIGEECVEGKCTAGVCEVRKEDPATSTDPTAPEEPPTVTDPFSGCTDGSQCKSGFCVEGICCDKACAGKCESCSLPGSPGVCTLQPYGTDKKDACGGAGGCVGTCDGKGECMGATAGTQCAPVRCVGPAKGKGPAICPKKGAPCPEDAAEDFDCTPFACEKALGACRSTCGTSENCAPGYICDAPSRLCVRPASNDDSGGCAYGAGGSSTGAFLAALGLLGLTTRRRRRA